MKLSWKQNGEILVKSPEEAALEVLARMNFTDS